MALIPKLDATNEASVTDAKAALEKCQSTEAALQSRHGGAEKRVTELTQEAGDASAAIYIAEAEQASEADLAQLREAAAAKIAELDAAKRERDALAHALAVAAGHTNDARVNLTRVAFRAHANRIAKLLEKLLAETVRLENSIETSVGHYKTILEHLQTLKSSWPGDLPPISELTTAGLTVAIEQHLYKVGTVIDPTLNMPTVKFPGARAHDLALLGQPERLPSISDGINSARRFLLDVLEGRKDARTGAIIPSGAELAVDTAAATSAA